MMNCGRASPNCSKNFKNGIELSSNGIDVSSKLNINETGIDGSLKYGSLHGKVTWIPWQMARIGR